MPWHARLQLDYTAESNTSSNSARTVARYEHNGPLRILQSLYPEGDAICHNVLVHPPGGLVGGDTTASDSGLVVNVTAIGRIADSHIKRRSDARPGDLIAVGGSLGESGAGLRDILAGRYDTPLAQIHRNPAPQVAEGIWLGERPEVHAMMDISDGIASDLRHILHRSGVGAEVDTECIPTPVDLETAVSGGEDYKLLFTVAPESANTLLSNYRLRFGDEFHFIGRITGGNHLEWLRNGTPLPVDWQGFRHY